MTTFNNFKSFTNERPSIVRRKANEYYEIQVVIGGHKPVRELILATCKAEAIDKAKTKYKYVQAEVTLVPSEQEKLKTSGKVKRSRRKKNSVDASSQSHDAVGISTSKDQTQA